MKSLVLLVLLVAVAAAGYTHSYLGHRGAYHSSPYVRTYASHHVPSYYGAHHGAYSHGLYRHRREAEAEPEAEAEAEPGTYVYNTLPYHTYNPHYAPYYTVNPAAVKVKSTATVPAATYHYAPYGPYGHHTYPYAFNPYHYPYVVKPVEETEAEEPTAATSDDAETVEVSRKRRDAEAEAEADPALKVVSHHVRPYPYHTPVTYTHHGVVPKVVKTYTAAHTYPAHTYSRYGYPGYTGYYGYPGYSGYVY